MQMINGESRQNGSVVVLLAVAIVAIIGIAAFAIDLGYGLVVKSELQNVADTGALAGTRELALFYDDLSANCPPNTTCWWGTYLLQPADKARIAAKVNTFSLLNKAGGVPITVRTNEDMVYGKYDTASAEIVPTNPADTGVMGIRVTARRDENVNETVATWLGRVIGTDSMSIHASSAATLSPLGKLPPGGIGIPVGISEFWFKAKNSPCGKRDPGGHGIRLFPTGPQPGETITDAQGCAGWHTYEDNPANANTLKTILGGLVNGQFQSPATEAGVTKFNFIGGAVATAFEKMKVLYESKKKNGEWTTIVPVYKSSDCSNPMGPIEIVGFATARIYSIKTSPNNTIDATVECDVIDIGEGGGDDFGTLVGRPGMVE